MEKIKQCLSYAVKLLPYGFMLLIAMFIGYWAKNWIELIEEAINEHMGEDEDNYTLVITTDKQVAEKALKEYQSECRYNPYNKVYLIEYATLEEIEIELDDVWDEDDRKRLESFKGTIEGNDMDMKVSYELFNLIEENYKYLDFYYNNDFVKLKITDFD